MYRRPKSLLFPFISVTANVLTDQFHQEDFQGRFPLTLFFARLSPLGDSQLESFVLGAGALARSSLLDTFPFQHWRSILLQKIMVSVLRAVFR
jgi:hypothetical protein